jgi:pimeloyl-ACP methyl ester carboxylesterase
MGDIAQADYLKTGPVRLFLTFQFSLEDRLEDKLPRVRAPMLVVRGALDPICSQEWAEFVARRLPRGRLVVLPDVAHTLVYTAARELAAARLPLSRAPRDSEAERTTPANQGLRDGHRALGTIR